jgi:hypothetical protein
VGVLVREVMRLQVVLSAIMTDHCLEKVRETAKVRVSAVKWRLRESMVVVERMWCWRLPGVQKGTPGSISSTWEGTAAVTATY